MATSPTLRHGAMSGAHRFLKTLNVSDYPWAVDDYNAGTLGHRTDTFPEACALAKKHGFNATNLHADFLRSKGPEAVREVLAAHGLQPGAMRFPVKLTYEASDAEFEQALQAFVQEAPM